MKKIIEKSSLYLDKVGIYLILLIASLLRFRGLEIRDFWYDEAFTGVAIKESWPSMIQMIINDVHPPLYYILLKLFAQFFNYSVFGIRLFSAIFGVIAVYLIYLFAKELFNKKTALYAALLTAIAPFAIQYSQEARMYTMLITFILLAAYFFVKGMKSQERKYFIFWGFFTGLSMLVHYMGLIFSTVYYLIYLFTSFSKEKFIFEKATIKSFVDFLRKLLPSKEIFYGYLVTLLTFLPWLKMFIYHLGSKGNNLDWVKPASLGDIVVNVQMFLFGTPLGEMSSGMPQPNEFLGVAHISTRIVLGIALAFITLYLFKKESKEKFFTLFILSFGFLFIVYYMSLLEQNYFVARYLLPGAYFVYVFIALWISKLQFKYVLTCFTLYLILLFSIVPVGFSKGYNEMAKNLDKYKGNDFYILNSFDYVIAKYYVGADHLTLFNIDWPQYNPSYWAAIGTSLKRTENFEDLRKNPKALILSNVQLDKNQRSDKTFDPSELELVDQYTNIRIYRFKKL